MRGRLATLERMCLPSNRRGYVIQAGVVQARLPDWRRRNEMGIGVSVFLLAIGAILTFATNVSVSGLDLDVVGIVLMVVGLIGLLMTLLVWGPRRRVEPAAPAVAERPVVERPVVERPVAERRVVEERPVVEERRVYDDGGPL